MEQANSIVPLHFASCVYYTHAMVIELQLGWVSHKMSLSLPALQHDYLIQIKYTALKKSNLKKQPHSYIVQSQHFVNAFYFI